MHELEKRLEGQLGAAPDVRRPSSLRLQHVALRVTDLRACERFYCEMLGLRVVWRPDEHNVYLTNGGDNLALHQTPEVRRAALQSLDHIGFALAEERSPDECAGAFNRSTAARSAPARAERPTT
jgi:catechol 2,3-dioxygenase-like lactoylglutathione lyase family enzyme